MIETGYFMTMPPAEWRESTTARRLRLLGGLRLTAHRLAARADARSTASLAPSLRSGSRGASRFARSRRETWSRRDLVESYDFASISSRTLSKNADVSFFVTPPMRRAAMLATVPTTFTSAVHARSVAPS